MKATVGSVGSTQYSVRSTQYSVLSTQYLVLSTEYSVLGRRHSVPRRGLTLAELLIVISILSVLATLVLPVAGNFLGESRGNVTQQSSARLRDVMRRPTGRTPIGISPSAARA